MPKPTTKPSRKTPTKTPTKAATKAATKSASKASPKVAGRKPAAKAAPKPLKKAPVSVKAATPARKVTKKLAKTTVAKKTAAKKLTAKKLTAPKPAAVKPMKRAAKPAPKAPVATKAAAKKSVAKKPAPGTAQAPAVVQAPPPADIAAAVTEWIDEPAPQAVAQPEAQAEEAAPEPRVYTPLDARAFALEAARLLSDDKCVDVIVLDVSKLTSVSEFIVIGTGTSDRQMRSVLDDVADLGQHTGHQVARKSVDERATWVLADFVDVVVHLFEPNTRAYYDLEMMWGDAPRLAWERPASERPKPRNRRVVVE